MNEQLKTNLTSSKHWVRLVYMLLFSFLLYIASFVIAILVLIQFLFALITGADNRKLRNFGNSTAIYIKDVLMFLTFNSEHKAFPFADWPTLEEPVQDDDSSDDESETENALGDNKKIHPPVGTSAKESNSTAKKKAVSKEIDNDDSSDDRDETRPADDDSENLGSEGKVD